MAHAPETKTALRAAYVFDRLTLEIASAKSGVSFSTAQSWKRAAKQKGDDWDKARTAAGLSKGAVDELSQRILNDFLIQFQSTQNLLVRDESVETLQKVQALTALADSLAKMTACLGRLMPEINRAVIAKDVIDSLARFIAENYPQHRAIFIEILAPFSQQLASEVKAKKR
jgi:hypothetical protein